MHEKRKRVAMLLAKYFLSTTWLAYQLNCKGVDISYQTLNNYLVGRRRKSDNCERVLDLSLDILDEYGRLYGERD